VSSTIPYLPTALGASKATLLLGNVASSGPYAWQLPQCTITSNPYGGYTGTYGLLNCIAIQNGAISEVVWFYEPPGGYGVILSFQYPSQYPNSEVNREASLYILPGNTLGAGDWTSPGYWGIKTPISPGWHMAVVEEWATSTSGPYYLALYLDGQFIGQTTTTYLPDMFGWQSNFPYDDIGTGYSGPGFGYPSVNWWFFNGAIALVALYNRVLTTGDVLAIWQGNLVSSGLVAVWYGDDYNPSNGYWVSRVGGYTGVPVTSSYPPRDCILWNSALYSGPVGIWSNWQQC
jgi:hypothetical protein